MLIFVLIANHFWGTHMFKYDYNQENQILTLSGNLDASKAEELKEILERIDNTVTVDMSSLTFISSVGIGVLVMTYRNLKERGYDIYLTNLNDHIRKVFSLSFLDKVFIIK